MLTAIKRVHAGRGPWVTNGGYEYNLVLIAAVLALAETGPGALAFGRGRSGPWWSLAALGGGVAGAAAAHYAAERYAAEQSVAAVVGGSVAEAGQGEKEPEAAAA
jgi:putative oxidoreductase